MSPAFQEHCVYAVPVQQCLLYFVPARPPHRRNNAPAWSKGTPFRRLLVGRSLTLSGMGLGLCQTIADRSIQPSSCRAKAARHGWPIRFFAGRPSTVARCFGPRCLSLARHALPPMISGGLNVADCAPRHPPVGIAQVEPVGAIIAQHPPNFPAHGDDVGQPVG